MSSKILSVTLLVIVSIVFNVFMMLELCICI